MQKNRKRLIVLNGNGTPCGYITPDDGVSDAKVNWELNGDSKLSFTLPVSSKKFGIASLIANSIEADGQVYTSFNDDAIKTTREQSGKLSAEFTLNDRWKNEATQKYCTIYNDMNGYDSVAKHTVMLVSYPNGDISIGGENYDSTKYVAVNGQALNAPADLAAGTAKYILYFLLQGTGWSLDGRYDAYWPDTIFDLETEKKTLYENVKSVQELFGGILLIDTKNRRIALADEDKWFPESTFEIRYQSNLKTISKTENREIHTRVYPYGNDDLSIASINNGTEYIDSSTAAGYPQPLEYIAQNSDIYNQDTLKEWGKKQAELYGRPRYTYTCETVDRRLISNALMEKFTRGCGVKVIDPDVTGGVVEQRAISGEYSFFNEADANLTFGDKSETFIGTLKDIKRNSDTVSDTISSGNTTSGLKVSSDKIVVSGLSAAELGVVPTRTLNLTGALSAVNSGMGVQNTKITQANDTATDAHEIASEAHVTADNASADARSAVSTSASAVKTADGAYSKSEAALSASANAVNTANGASASASAAFTASAEAVSTANGAYSQATAAMTAATNNAKASVIVSAINNSSSVTINADRIDMNGLVSAWNSHAYDMSVTNLHIGESVFYVNGHRCWLSTANGENVIKWS